MRASFTSTPSRWPVVRPETWNPPVLSAPGYSSDLFVGIDVHFGTSGGAGVPTGMSDVDRVHCDRSVRPTGMSDLHRSHRGGAQRAERWHRWPGRSLNAASWRLLTLRMPCRPCGRAARLASSHAAHQCSMLHRVVRIHRGTRAGGPPLRHSVDDA